MAASKSKRPSKRRRKKQTRWIALAFLALLVAGYAFARPYLHDWLGWGLPPIEDKGPAVRVVTWNLHNYDGDLEKQDVRRMQDTIERLDPDLLALQEVRYEQKLGELLPEGWSYEVSHQGGRGGQHVALAWNPAALELQGKTRQHSSLTLGGRVRPGFSGHFKSLRGGPDFSAFVVHLKAMPDGLQQRRRQWPRLAKEVKGVVDKSGDRDVIVLGDFNVTGKDELEPEGELAQLEDELSAAELRRLPVAGGCSAYWDGESRDAWKEPSLLDLVWVGGLTESIDASTQAIPGAHCSRHACASFRSTNAHPDLDFEGMSDHCPLVVDLRAADDD